MSDVMLFGVLRMPYEMAMSSELSRRQFWDRAQEAASRLESQPEPAQVEALTGLVDCGECWNGCPAGKCRKAAPRIAPLPPLPESTDRWSEPSYTAEQMRAYALAALRPQAAPAQPAQPLAHPTERSGEAVQRADGGGAVQPVAPSIEAAHQRVLMEAFRSDLAALLERCCGNWYRVRSPDDDEIAVHIDVLRALATPPVKPAALAPKEQQ